MLPFVMELFRGTITPGLSVIIILLSMVSFFFRGRHGDVNFQEGCHVEFLNIYILYPAASYKTFRTCE